MSTLLWIVAALAMFLGAIFLWQDRLLYFPATAAQEQLVAGPLRAWPSAEDFRGLVAEPAGAVRGTVVIFHGNAGHAGDRAWYADALVPLGLRVILAEYPGYGPRAGTVGEATFVPDAEETVAIAHRRYGDPLLVAGESLGAAVAAAAGAGQRESTAGLLLITPWAQLAPVASHHYPWLPVRWMLRDGYDSAGRLAQYDRPVVVVVAEQDSVVPARFGRALHAALGDRSQLMVLPGREHNDWPEAVDERWWRGVIDRLLGAQEKPAPEGAGADRTSGQGR